MQLYIICFYKLMSWNLDCFSICYLLFLNDALLKFHLSSLLPIECMFSFYRYLNRFLLNKLDLKTFS